MTNKANDDCLWYPFRIIVGLLEGYDAGQKLHNAEEVEAIITDWLIEALKHGKPYLPGMVSTKTMLYVRRQEPRQVLKEPVAIFEGEVNPLFGNVLKEEAYLRALWDLAERLSSALNQTRIYIKFRDRVLVLEKHVEPPPPVNPRCSKCKDTGVLNLEGDRVWPCDCQAGDRAMFVSPMGDDISGETLKRLKRENKRHENKK